MLAINPVTTCVLGMSISLSVPQAADIIYIETVFRCQIPKRMKCQQASRLFSFFVEFCGKKDLKVMKKL